VLQTIYTVILSPFYFYELLLFTKAIALRAHRTVKATGKTHTTHPRKARRPLVTKATIDATKKLSGGGLVARSRNKSIKKIARERNTPITLNPSWLSAAVSIASIICTLLLAIAKPLKSYGAAIMFDS
jgi:hypothetical protein